MKFSGTVDINAPRERVWAFLMDPDQVGPCGPGTRDRTGGRDPDGTTAPR